MSNCRTTPPRTADPAVRREQKLLKKLGWTYLRSKGGHMLWGHPEYGQITLSISPSDGNFHRQHRRRLAKMMGLANKELERLARKVGVR